MLELSKNELHWLSQLCQGKTDIELLACLEGNMGRAWADRGNNPDIGWVSFIEKNYADNLNKFKRYMFKKEENVFQKDRLMNFIMSVELEFQIDIIDESNYYRVIEDRFMADCCCFFLSIDKFLKHGTGYIIEGDGEIVAGASSYSFCKDNISITVGTIDKYRRKRLATACASKLILDCINKNIYPRWDAANLQSVSLAEKLGYHFEKNMKSIRFIKDVIENNTIS